MIRNILICTTQVPFTKGGAEALVEGLRRALIEAGYNAEVVALPFKWYPPAEMNAAWSPIRAMTSKPSTPT